MSDIVICNERFRAMVLPNAPLETLGESYRWLEGPVWFADHDCLYVSDIPNDDVAATRIVWRSNRDALLRDPDGHLHVLAEFAA